MPPVVARFDELGERPLHGLRHGLTGVSHRVREGGFQPLGSNEIPEPLALRRACMPGEDARPGAVGKGLKVGQSRLECTLRGTRRTPADTDGARILDVRGSNANPYTAGVICNKVARSYPEFVHGSERLTRPLKRVGRRGGDTFAPISWDEALDLIHAGISGAVARHGPQTVLPLNYAGPHGELAGGSMDRRFFHKLGASLLARGQLCGIVRGSAYASLYGAAPGMPPEQIRHSDLVVVWGNNVTVSNLHLAREIQAARKGAGARLIVVDPKRTRIAEQADLFIQIRPGTDAVLALAMAAELERRGAHDRAFIDRWVDGCDDYMAHARAHTPEMVAEVCGIDRATFDTFAHWYCDATTAGVSVGNGIERGRSGGSGLRAAMALQALTGNHGRLGAGVFAKPGHAFPKGLISIT